MRYLVIVTAQTFETVVEADSEHEAEEIAINAFHDGYVLDEVRDVQELPPAPCTLEAEA